MSPAKKKLDAQEIEAFFDSLASEPWLANSSKRWWPKFLFFFSDVRNVVSILEHGKLLARNQAARSNLMVIDCASHEVLDSTNAELKDYVRLYFRPLTPTQYRNEGIRPLRMQQLGAHCPVPVFLLFDSKSVLTRSDCEFSDGNLASPSVSRGIDAKFLRALPFRRIYHHGWYDPDKDSDIKFHRHAEALIPKALDLSNLRYIFCRTPAEKETLWHLLSSPARQKWGKRIFVEGKQNLFQKRWTFVEHVELSSNRLVFHFSPDTETPGPFEVRLRLIDLERDKGRTRVFSDYYVKSSAAMNFSKRLTSYAVTLELDGNLAYANRFDSADIPF